MQVGANGITLEVEDHGSPNGEPLVLIMGLGMQLVGWHEDFVASLVKRGFRVIRFDNRDAGLSQRFDQFGVPNLMVDALRHTIGWPVASPYSIADMADDTAALLDVLGLRSAHVCGASMGGMVAQHLAVRHAARLRSLTLMMTTSGARRLPGPSLRVQRALLSRAPNPHDIDGLIRHAMRVYRLIGSPGYPSSDAWLRDRLGLAIRRAYRPQGVARQLVAIAADGDRTPLLARIKAPVQIIHGQQDPLVPVAAAHDLAAHVAGARLDLVDGMGHDLPPALWPRFADAIAAAAARSVR